MYMNNTVFFIDMRDKKALEHYDFLWEVMEENLNGVNSKKQISVVLTPPPTTHQPMLQDDTQVQSNKYCVGTF